MLKRFDLTRGRHIGSTEGGLDWAGGQFLSLRGGDPCGIFVRDRKILAYSRKGKVCLRNKFYRSSAMNCRYFSRRAKSNAICNHVVDVKGTSRTKRKPEDKISCKPSILCFCSIMVSFTFLKSSDTISSRSFIDLSLAFSEFAGCFARLFVVCFKTPQFSV